MEVPFTAIHGSVRLSLSRYNTDEEFDTIVEVFPQVVANLGKVSPYWDAERNVPRPDALNLVQR
jgi:cysteine desulfurase